MAFELEERYVVLKKTDLEKYVPKHLLRLLGQIGEQIDSGRKADGKTEFDCVVVEHDWPEYRLACDAIAKRVKRENCDHEYTGVVVGDPMWCKFCGAGGPPLD